MATLRLSDLDPAVRARVRASNGSRITDHGSRRRGGKRAEEAGKAFQRLILRTAARSLAVELEALPACGARFVGKGKAHPLPICCDLAGCYIGSGRGIYIDAKSMLEKTGGIRLGDPKIVKPHQAAFLHRMARAGAVAGLLVERRPETRNGDGRGDSACYLWLDGRELLEGKAVKWDDRRWVQMAGRIDWAAMAGRAR